LIEPQQTTRIFQNNYVNSDCIFCIRRSTGFAADQGAAPPLETKSEDSPEEKLKLFEKKVNELIEESCLAASRGENQLVLS